MPCHVRSATKPKKRRRPSLLMSPPCIVAVLDMSRDIERETQAFLTRACSGRRPLWRLLRLYRRESTLFAAVEWRRSVAVERFSLVEIALDQCALKWRDYLTAADACAALAALDDPQRPAVPAALAVAAAS